MKVERLRKVSGGLMLALLLIGAGAVYATLIPIVNHNFENPVLSGSETPTVIGWTESSNWTYSGSTLETAAIWKSASTWYPGTEGYNVLLLRTWKYYPERYSFVWQEVGTVNEGVYTLKAVVARRDASLAFIPNLFLWLCAFNGTSMVALPADEVVAPTPAANSYQEWSYKVTISAGSPYIGMPLRVYFGGYGNGGGTISYAVADNFRLEYVPEPATVCILGVGSWYMLIKRRKIDA